MSKIKEYFQGLVKKNVIPQEPANYDAATLKIYIDHLESENAALRERLEKAVEFPRIRKSANYARTGKYVVEFIREDDGGVDLDIDLTKEEAEARLKELKEKKQ